MPGPRNSRKKQKGPSTCSKPRLSIESTSSFSTASSDSQHPRTPPPISPIQTPQIADTGVGLDDGYPGEGLLDKPFIYDPGNGHRVRDTRAFLSSFFARPPALDDPLCAEFSQTKRIRAQTSVRRHNSRSTVCFILASYNYPAAIKSAWGHTADEMHDEAWTLLNSTGDGNAISGVSVGLGMLVRMTGLHDLGLAQLCLPDVGFDEDGPYSDGEDIFGGHAPIHA
ncbi:hypothetical protein C8R45DRAFT_1089769 [Mycena sanguinolenta]|nr:hypothetical protein C8R45DRAFT_1089769 [Mycena sanguinolenta]